MAVAIVLVFCLGLLGLLAYVVRFVVGLTLLAVCIALVVAIAAYALSFLGFYFIFGEANIGWAIFGAMGLGTVIVSSLIKKLARLFRPVLDKSQAPQ